MKYCSLAVLVFFCGISSLKAQTREELADTTYRFVSVHAYRTYVGKVIRKDSAWVVVLQSDGSKVEIPTAQVTAITQLESGGLSFNGSRGQTHSMSINPPLSPYRVKFADLYVAPFLLVGKAITSGNSNATGGLAYSVGLICARAFPGYLPEGIGGFFAAAFDSRALIYKADAQHFEHDLSVSYLTLTPGISFRGLFSLGFTIGFPISMSSNDFSNNDAGTKNVLRLSLSQVLLEPKLILSLPIDLDANDNKALLLLVEAGYPLSSPFNVSDVQFSSTEKIAVSSLRIPQVQIGLSYVFSLTAHSSFLQSTWPM